MEESKIKVLLQELNDEVYALEQLYYQLGAKVYGKKINFPLRELREVVENLHSINTSLSQALSITLTDKHTSGGKTLL